MNQDLIVWAGKQLQVQHPLQKAEDPRGASKHGDMLDDKQGRDVGP